MPIPQVGSPVPEIKVTIQGLQKAQRRIAKVMRDMQPASAPQAATIAMTKMAYQEVLTWIHVDTGALKAAQRMRFDHELMGSIITSNVVMNPKTLELPANYVGVEFARGGSHDTYAMVVTYRGDNIAYAGFWAMSKYIMTGA